ncbi:MAG: DUF2064 domain-containing protein [Mycobacteriaceae bacterium]
MNPAPERTTLLVVAKAPVPGLAKTRLTSVLTPTEAAEVAAAALLDTLDAVAGVPGVRRVVALTGDLGAAARAPEIRRVLAGFTVIGQRGGSLGERLAAAHADAGPGPVLQIGMDTPQVGATLLADTAARLAGPDVDAVLGPAADGGWWGLGVVDPTLAAVLVGVPTSQPDTGVRTLAALRAVGARVQVLAPLADVDTPDDARAVAALVPGSRFAAAVIAAGLVPEAAAVGGGVR